MDLGTGKDLAEYGTIPYHLIDIVNPGHEYNVFEFSTDFCSRYAEILQRAKLPFLVGGTGMYLDAVLSQYQLTIADSDEASRKALEAMSDEELVRRLFELKPSQHNTTDLLERKRLIRAIEIAQAELTQQQTIVWPQLSPLILGINMPRPSNRKHITARLKQRLKEGMIEEVETLHRQGLSWEQLDFYGLEYRYIAQYLQQKLSYNDMFQKLNAAIHQFAKQQEKWFRKIQNKGHEIHWLNPEHDMIDEAAELIERYAAPR